MMSDSQVIYQFCLNCRSYVPMNETGTNFW